MRQQSSHRTPLRSTICPDCKRDIGVQPEYNYSIAERGAKPGVWRLSVHRREFGGPRCTASRALVDPSLVREKKQSA